MTLGDPRVSILVITYDQEHLIGETIESCLQQTYGNIEIVISDDGSTDQTPQILQDIQRKNPGIVRLVLNPRNQGITANCNAGLAACSGEYVALVGGDDLLLPNKVALQVEAFQNNPELVLSYHWSHAMRNGVMGELIGDRPKDIVNDMVGMIGNFGAQMPGAATMVRTSAIPAGGFNVEIGTASDWMFFIDVSSHGEVRRIDEPLAIYRQHGGNVGERYFSYSDDFIRTLHLVSERYGDRFGVKDAVRKGGTRFLLGIIYRAIEQGRPELARKYARSLPDYSSSALALLVGLVIRVPGSRAIFTGLKAGLKRHV